MPINVQCKRCAHLINDWCKEKLDSPDPDMVRNCLYYKEATNADRIRAMADEDLAWKFAEAQGDPHNSAVMLGWLAWLQSPAEGGDGDG